MLGAEFLHDQPGAVDAADSAWSQALSSFHNRLWFLPLLLAHPLSSEGALLSYSDFCGCCFLPPLISGQYEQWSQMQLLWVCCLADSLQVGLLSKLMLHPLSFALQRSSVVQEKNYSIVLYVFFSYFLLHAFSHPASLSDLISGVISEWHLFHILQRRQFPKHSQFTVTCSA